MLTAEQLAQRVNSIGSSDAAGVLGLSRWSTPLAIWGAKTGNIPQQDISNELAIEVGNELEELVCKLFVKRTGKQVRRVNETAVHAKYPFLTANIDRRVVGEDTLLEAKTASGWKAREWLGEDIPQEYIIQVLHQLAVTGKSKGYIACLIGGNQQFVWKEIHRDEKLIEEIVTKEVAFWKNFIEPKVFPTTITKKDAPVLYALFPDGDETAEIELGDEANRTIENLEALKVDLKTLEGVIDKEENELKAMLKDKAIGVTDKYKVTWKNQTTNRLDTTKVKEQEPVIYTKYLKPSVSRVLRYNKLKKGGN